MTTGYVIRLIELANGDVAPNFDGKYVVSYDPTKWRWREIASTEELEQLLGEFLTVTDDINKAKVFPTMLELHEFYSQIGPGIRPWDGKPNRPITAFHVQTQRVGA